MSLFSPIPFGKAGSPSHAFHAHERKLQSKGAKTEHTGYTTETRNGGQEPASMQQHMPLQVNCLS